MIDKTRRNSANKVVYVQNSTNMFACFYMNGQNKMMKGGDNMAKKSKRKNKSRSKKKQQDLATKTRRSRPPFYIKSKISKVMF
ncbi:hypothetical protein JS44_05610 [Anoxybacillus flavithermus]|uniref:Uncharacterized protein n=1 Tax=Anoxybacillus flavithermus TaxID=33934 RepID=A0A094J331_9BACL|nr:hypothetical protein JS44_05610 [Anoxybacillus flavithermus]